MCSFVFMLYFVLYTAHATWLDNQATSSGGGGGGGVSGVSCWVSDVLKVLILFVQYLVIISSLPIPWPQSVSLLFDAANWLFAASGGQALSPDCLLTDQGGRLPVAIQRELIALCAPVCILAAALLLHLLGWCMLRVAGYLAGAGRSSRRSLQIKRGLGAVIVNFPVVCLVVLFVFCPTLLRVPLNFSACYLLHTTTAGSPLMYEQFSTANASHGYWLSDMSQPCWEGWHFWWAVTLGVAITAMLCVGVPAALFVVLYCNRSRLQLPAFRCHFGWLYRTFRSSCFWWEGLQVVQTCVVVALSAFRFTLGVYYTLPCC